MMGVLLLLHQQQQQQQVVWISLVLAFISASATQRSTSFPPPPHILFILVDDLGWGNVGYHVHPSALQRQQEVQTPVIDWLAKQEGLELNRHYVRAFTTQVCRKFVFSMTTSPPSPHVTTIGS
jgi:hypothetical protein